MSTRQITATVKDGRRVTFRTALGDLTGYIGGMDDYHWLLVTSDGEVMLIHKTAALVISIEPTETYAGEPRRSVLDRIIAPYRRFVLKTYYGQSEVSATTEHAEEYAPC